MCGALGIYQDSGSSDPKAVRARVREEPHWLPRTAAHLNLHALGGGGRGPHAYFLHFQTWSISTWAGQPPARPEVKSPNISLPWSCLASAWGPTCSVLGSSRSKRLPEVPRHTGHQAEWARGAPVWPHAPWPPTFTPLHPHVIAQPYPQAP